MDARTSTGNWRPAVVGTGGIQEDRVPGAREPKDRQEPPSESSAAFSSWWSNR